MSRYTVFIIIVSIFVGISGLAIEVEALTHGSLKLSFSDYTLFLDWQEIVILAMMEIGLGTYFLFLLHGEEQQEAIVLGQH